MTSMRWQTEEIGERALRELTTGGEIEPGWRVAYQTTDDSGGAKVYRLWFEREDHSDSFGVRFVVDGNAPPQETEAAAVEEVKRLIRARRL